MFHHRMFSVPIFQMNCINWSLKKEKIKKMESFLEVIDPKNKKQNDNESLYTDFYDKKINYDSFLLEIFLEEINEFKNKSNTTNIKIKNSWFEKSLTNNFHGVHNHGPTGYSAVCYVDYCEVTHTPIKFISPFNNFLNGSTLSYTPTDVKEGTIIFFPSLINHYTFPNFSSKERLVISFNMCVEQG